MKRRETDYHLKAMADYAGRWNEAFDYHLKRYAKAFDKRERYKRENRDAKSLLEK